MQLYIHHNSPMYDESSEIYHLNVYSGSQVSGKYKTSCTQYMLNISMNMDPIITLMRLVWSYYQGWCIRLSSDFSIIYWILYEWHYSHCLTLCLTSDGVMAWFLWKFEGSWLSQSQMLGNIFRILQKLLDFFWASFVDSEGLRVLHTLKG